ncbi:MAG: hypothetical protein LBP67_01915 [Bacteroidales bacterium]|jgi:hypothetical protein|nr:hypothetical protein [Bacteroidales bacterium]
MKKQTTQNEKTRIFKTGLVLVSLTIFTFTNVNAMNAITQANKANETTMFVEFSLMSSLPATQNAITFMRVEEAIEKNEELRNLFFGIQPTVLINNGGITINSAEPAILAKCRDNAVNKLYDKEEDYKNVKVLHIYIDDLNYSDLDLSLLNSFSNLEYIIISFTYEACGNTSDSCILSLVQNMIKTGDKPITVLYQLSISQ